MKTQSFCQFTFLETITKVIRRRNEGNTKENKITFCQPL